MKKKILAVAIFILVLGGAAAFAVFGNKTKTSEQPKNNTIQKTFNPSKACEIFTLEDAKKILGNNAEQAKQSNTVQPKIDNLSVSDCSYGAGQISSNKNAGTVLTAVGIVVRSPLNQKGASANQTGFESQISSGTKIDNYGDRTFWIPATGQLNVLKNGSWITVMVSNTIPGTGRTKAQASAQIKTGPGSLEDAKKVADIVLAKI